MLPVITIARQYGSGGHEVGEKLAKRLNVPFYDKALIAMAAKQSGGGGVRRRRREGHQQFVVLHGYGQLCLWGPSARHQRDAHQRQAVHPAIGYY